MGVLFYDIVDSKFYNGDEIIGLKIVCLFLENENVFEDIIKYVVNIIENILYKGGNFEKKFFLIELDIV